MINAILHFFYKLFHGPYPCGRTKDTQHLCCTRRPTTWLTSYTSPDGKKVYCRFCNSLKMMASEPINLKKPFQW